MKENNDAMLTTQSPTDSDCKAYQTPQIIEYGNIQELTQGGSGSFPDYPGTRKEE